MRSFWYHLYTLHRWHKCGYGSHQCLQRKKRYEGVAKSARNCKSNINQSILCIASIRMIASETSQENSRMIDYFFHVKATDEIASMIKLEKDVFSSCHEHGTKKRFRVPIRNRASDLRIPCSDALPLSHRDSTVSVVYQEVHMTYVLHTARISNFDRQIIVDRYVCPMLVTMRKKSFSISLPSSKTYHLSYFYNTVVYSC